MILPGKRKRFIQSFQALLYIYGRMSHLIKGFLWFCCCFVNSFVHSFGRYNFTIDTSALGHRRMLFFFPLNHSPSVFVSFVFLFFFPRALYHLINFLTLLVICTNTKTQTKTDVLFVECDFQKDCYFFKVFRIDIYYKRLHTNAKWMRIDSRARGCPPLFFLHATRHVNKQYSLCLSLSRSLTISHSLSCLLVQLCDSG